MMKVRMKSTSEITILGQWMTLNMTQQNNYRRGCALASRCARVRKFGHTHKLALRPQLVHGLLLVAVLSSVLHEPR